MTDNEKALRNSIKTCIIFSIIALHELGHVEAAGWVAAFVAAVALLTMILIPLEEPLKRLVERMQKEIDEKGDGYGK